MAADSIVLQTGDLVSVLARIALTDAEARKVARDRNTPDSWRSARVNGTIIQDWGKTYKVKLDGYEDVRAWACACLWACTPLGAHSPL